ncbi:oligodendrocyte-myelin glycoprotein-like [Astyanax mexicanus]|uniref:Oligodendrocyte-myelin glycoprotein-like n=2 Tax=Astyanax mexicanus TaxID=7994 RepID=A0A8T2KWG2_ASTMX|nr:oligodendrocyte-myelin glycoprotein-like [Astyanax mexicanus]
MRNTAFSGMLGVSVLNHSPYFILFFLCTHRCALKMYACAPLSHFLMLLLLLGISAACPSVCSCSESQREVDCSWRGLRHLPFGLQPNIFSLNLSHNRLSDLDNQISPYTHLRTLDVSHNRLTRLPTSLPRSLWEIRASGNRIRLLEKNDTAYHWNLRELDLSSNKLERVVLINNTMPNLRALNLSHNRFWTVPTNMPQNLEIVDLSHNTLVQILPGSLDRLSKLSHFYLHANRFTMVNESIFEKLYGLRLITLGDNPWACEDKANISYLLAWARHTSARVLGCPCHTWPICGETYLARTRSWHFASYTLSPFGTAQVQGASTHYWSEKVSTVSHHRRETPSASSRPAENKVFKHGFPLTSTSDSISTLDKHAPTDGPFPTEDLLATDAFFSTTRVLTTSTRRTTTLRTRSVKRANQGLSKNASPERGCWDTFAVSLLVLMITHQVIS